MVFPWTSYVFHMIPNPNPWISHELPRHSIWTSLWMSYEFYRKPYVFPCGMLYETIWYAICTSCELPGVFPMHAVEYRMVCPMNYYGLPMDVPTNSICILYETIWYSLWISHPALLDFLWMSYVFLLDVLCMLYELPMYAVWYSYVSNMVSHMDSLCIQYELPMYSIWYAMDYPMVCYMGFP